MVRNIRIQIGARLNPSCAIDLGFKINAAYRHLLKTFFRSLLNPISSHARIATLLRRPFVGRKWLIEGVEQWRCATNNDSRLLLIVGNPGVGKSTFAAYLAHYGQDRIVAAQFIEWDKPDHRDAGRVVRSLAFQLACRLPDHRKLLLTLPDENYDSKSPTDLFNRLIAGPLRCAIEGGRERYLIIVDALDEANELGRNQLAEMLAVNATLLPDWIKIIVTCRPESAVVAPLQGLSPLVLDTRTEANQQDIRAYLEQELGLELQSYSNPDVALDVILQKAEGLFLYAERVCDDLKQGHLSLDRTR